MLENPLKWHALTPTSDLPSTLIKVCQEETPTKTLMELSLSTNIIRGEVFTSSPIIQKKQKAKRMNNKFKKMVHDPDSSNSS